MAEHYIPCSRSRLIELCIESSQLNAEDRKHFHQLSKILLAYVHHKQQETLEKLKASYANYDPNLDEPIKETTGQAEELVKTFTETLLNANYKQIQESDIQTALNQASLIPVQTSVDFNIYHRYLFFYRESNQKEIKEKKWFREKVLQFENYSRMAVLLHTKENNESVKEDETLKGGKIYLYLYKNIPHYDLEMLFPSLKISMTLKDKLLLIIPALGAAIPLLIKVLPSLALLIGAIAFFTFGLDIGTGFDANKQDDKAIYALLTAVLSVGIALGGFAVQQYIKYKSKRLSFLKQVTDVLFFKCLDTGAGVIHTIIDAAEEELCKEMILVLHILANSESALTEAEIDKQVENWLKEYLSVDMDFHVEKALNTLQSLGTNETLIYKDNNERYSIKDLHECKVLIDKLWDDIFLYN